jgi:hypothetical protein
MFVHPEAKAMLRSGQDLEAAIHWFHIFRFAEQPETVEPAVPWISTLVLDATTDIRIYLTYQAIGQFRSRSVDFRTIETAGDGFIDSVMVVTELLFHDSVT